MDSKLEIYTAFFGLRERPFALLPDPDFIYWSPTHLRAYSMLEYGLVSGAPITLITGEVGTGKTTLIQHFLTSAPEDVRIALLSQATNAREELLRWILAAFDLDAPEGAGYVALFERFQRFLIAEYAAGRRIVVIIDEAQTLDRDGLEELRMLTNINSGKDELIQLILVGQPELRERVRRPDLKQVAQRVAAAFHLPVMDAESVRAYIGHRLTQAGGGPETFTRAAMDRIYVETRGVPRLVNQLCDLAMVYAYSKDQREVTGRLVQAVLEDGVFFSGTSNVPSDPPFLRSVSGKAD